MWSSHSCVGGYFTGRHNHFPEDLILKKWFCLWSSLRLHMFVHMYQWIYRVFQKDLNDKNTFPWAIPYYHWSNMAYNTFEHISSLNFERSNETLPHRWIGRAVNNDLHLLLWPPTSPDLTPCDFSLWGYFKDNAHKPPLSQNVRELQDRIRAAVQTVGGNMVKSVCRQELDYRIDICRVTKGAHIEHLWADFYW